MAKASQQAQDKVRLLGVVVVHVFTCCGEAVGSRGYVTLIAGWW